MWTTEEVRKEGNNETTISWLAIATGENHTDHLLGMSKYMLLTDTDTEACNYVVTGQGKGMSR